MLSRLQFGGTSKLPVDLVNPVSDDPGNDDLLVWLLAGIGPRGNEWRNLAAPSNVFTLTNMTGTDWGGPFGRPGGFGGLDFDGSNDYVNFTGDLGIAVGDPFTVAWWQYRRAASYHAWESVDGSAPSAEDDSFWMNNGQNIVTATSTLNVWVHVCCCYDGAGQNQTAFTNGIIDGTNTSVAGDRITTFAFGAKADGSRNFNGLLDDLRVLRRGLTAEQVRELYTQSKLGHPRYLNRTAWYFSRKPAGGGATTMVADAGTYTLTGAAVPFAIGMPASAGSYVLTGAAVPLAIGMPVVAGAYTLTGAAVSFAIGMPASAGAYTLTGAAATTTRAITITADAGSYSLTGTAVPFAIGMPVSAGAYTLTGADATTTHTLGNTLTAEAGTYVVTGAAVGFGIAMPAAGGSYTLTGADATTSRTFSIGAEAGVFTVTGQAVTTIAPVVEPPAAPARVSQGAVGGDSFRFREDAAQKKRDVDIGVAVLMLLDN